MQGAESGCHSEKEKQIVLNCSRLLTRVLPYIFEDPDWRGFFWSTVPGAGRAGVCGPGCGAGWEVMGVGFGKDRGRGMGFAAKGWDHLPQECLPFQLGKYDDRAAGRFPLLSSPLPGFISRQPAKGRTLVIPSRAEPLEF